MRHQAEFEAFLDNPRSVSLAGPLAARTQWLEQLKGTYATKPTHAKARRGPGAGATDVNRKWVPKGDVAVVPGDEEKRGDVSKDAIRAGEVDGATHARDMQVWNAQLQEAKEWLESQLAAYKALAEQREGSIQELKTWNATLQAANASLDAEVRTQKTRADTLAGEVFRTTNELAQARSGLTWLEQQSRNWEGRAIELHGVVEQQQAALKSADEARRWLDEQRTGWESTARRNESDIVKLKAWIHELEDAKKWLAADRDKWIAVAENVRTGSPQRPG
ncbi:MAG: hypothetical protein H7210_00555 [Pyrinomonadaceae bacterium]|nr:hypothetical protein [Phycisphaerales bacterium]